MSKRQCHGTNRNGEPCKAAPLKGENWCRPHHPETPETDPFKTGRVPNCGRKPVPKVTDILRERVEAEVERVVRPLFDALDAEAALVVGGNSADARLEFAPDHKVRLQAVRDLLDRIYGKPRQSQEISGPDGGAITIADLARLAATDDHEG